VVFLIKALFAYVIPDLPEHIFIKLQREEYIAQEARRDYELRPKTAPEVNGMKAAISAKTKYKAFRYEKNQKEHLLVAPNSTVQTWTRGLMGSVEKYVFCEIHTGSVRF
jgi:hypothetical protein